jgi:hypothetical protein
MRFTLSASFLTLAIASSSNAQLPGSLISGLSASCLGGLSTLITNQAINTCLSLETALTTFSGTSGSSNSLVPDLQPYLANDICPQAACNASTLMSANSTITSACQTELNNGTTLVTPLTYLFTHYDVIREAACYKDGNDLCIVQTLE